MIRNSVKEDYFEWMFDLVSNGRFSKDNSYRELLSYLHSVEFTYRMRCDSDRAEDGVALRHRFALLNSNYSFVMKCLDGPCSVLEMMVALAIRCEEAIMDNPRFGNRTGQWFWKMVTSLGLGHMMDSRFDEQYVEEVVETFLNRKYSPEGYGGLFVIRNCDHDLACVSIWNQAMWFLDMMI